MILTEKQRKEIETLSFPLIEWLNKNIHPHCCIIIDCTRAELLEGVCATVTEKYIQD